MKWIRDIERLEIRAMEHFQASSGLGQRGSSSGWPLSLQVYRLFCDTVRATGMGTATDPGMEDFRPKESKEERLRRAAAGISDLHSQSGGDKFLTMQMVRDKFHEWEMPIDIHQAAEIYCHYDIDGDDDNTITITQSTTNNNNHMDANTGTNTHNSKTAQDEEQDESEHK